MTQTTSNQAALVPEGMEDRALAEYARWGTGCDTRRPVENRSWVCRQDEAGVWRETSTHPSERDADDARHKQALIAALNVTLTNPPGAGTDTLREVDEEDDPNEPIPGVDCSPYGTSPALMNYWLRKESRDLTQSDRNEAADLIDRLVAEIDAALAPATPAPAGDGVEGLRALSEAATPGRMDLQDIEPQDFGVPMIAVPDDIPVGGTPTNGIVAAAVLLPSEVPTDEFGGDFRRSQANAAFIRALWNGYRSGHLVVRAATRTPAGAADYRMNWEGVAQGAPCGEAAPIGWPAEQFKHTASAGAATYREDIQCTCVGSFGPNAECGRCGGSGCVGGEDGTSAGAAGDLVETDALVDRFETALKAKLRASEAKYGWQNGWLKVGWEAECQRDLARHVAKGDPLDVAAYAAFCWHHDWSTGRPSYQVRVAEWVAEVAKDDPFDAAEHRDRFAEEALELVQSLGQTVEDAHRLVDYVFGRPVGEPRQELGGTMVTLAKLATRAGLDMAEAGDAELARCWRPEMLDKIRRKRATRHGRRVLPGGSVPASQAPAASVGGANLREVLKQPHKRTLGPNRFPAGISLWSQLDQLISDYERGYRDCFSYDILLAWLEDVVSALTPTVQAQPAGREEIARIITPWAFAMTPADYGTDEVGFKRTQAYGARLVALAKADAILDAQPVADGGADSLWKPIETAPRDGTAVLVYEDGTTPDETARSYSWIDVAKFEQPDRGDDGWYSVGGDRGPPSCNPTHWQPLPAPPTPAPAPAAQGDRGSDV